MTNSGRITPITPIKPSHEAPVQIAPQRKEQEHKVSPMQKNATGELFPNIKRNNPLPEVGAKGVDFNRNSWSSRASKHEEEIFGKLPKVGGYYVATIAGRSYDIHMDMLKKQLNLFHTTRARVDKLRDEKFELIKKQIENGKKEGERSYAWDLARYSAISANFATGLALTMAGQTYAGTQMMAGSALMAGGELAEKYLDQGSTLAQSMGWAGGLALTLAGIGKSLAALLASNLAGDLGTGVKTAYDLSNHYVQKKGIEAQAKNMELQSKNVTNKFKQETAKQEMDKIVGGFAKKEHVNTASAAIKLIETEERIKSDIARGKD